MIPIIDAIVALDPNTQVSVVDEDMKQILWHDGNPNNITSSQIKTKQIELQAEYDAKEYSRKREVEYPSIQECVHAILDDQLDALQAKRAEIKTKYPKG